MANIRSFRELIVWQRAMDAAMEIFRLTEDLPSRERFSLTGQVRRSSRSVAANLAEAWRKRRYPAAFVAKLSDSEAEAAETQTHVEIARRCAYFNDHTTASLEKQYEEILAMLVAMAANPDQWVIR